MDLDQQVEIRTEQMKDSIKAKKPIIECIDRCIDDLYRDNAKLSYDDRSVMMSCVITAAYETYGVSSWINDLIKPLNQRINSNDYDDYHKAVYDAIRNCITGFVTMGLLQGVFTPS